MNRTRLCGQHKKPPCRILSFKRSGAATAVPLPFLFGCVRGYRSKYTCRSVRLLLGASLACGGRCTLFSECIYRHKPNTFREADDLIDRYIYFYNHERIQNRTGVLVCFILFFYNLTRNSAGQRACRSGRPQSGGGCPWTDLWSRHSRRSGPFPHIRLRKPQASCNARSAWNMYRCAR